jgi:tRNA A37 threonylcarbamoyladenosine modification protein TsaB
VSRRSTCSPSPSVTRRGSSSPPSTPSAARSSTPSTARCRAGCSGSPGTRSPDDLASELLTARDEILLVGDGALRYHEAFEGLKRVELADQGLAHPSAASLVQLAHAQALREQFVAPWELTPLYLRKPDAEINWASRDAERR